MDRNVLIGAKLGSILTKEIISGNETYVTWNNHHYMEAEEYEKEFHCEEYRVHSAEFNLSWCYSDNKHLVAHLLALLHFFRKKELVFIDHTETISEMALRYPLLFNVENAPGGILNKITLCKPEDGLYR